MDHYHSNNEIIITIITRFIMSYNGLIITYYWPPGFGDSDHDVYNKISLISPRSTGRHSGRRVCALPVGLSYTMMKATRVPSEAKIALNK